MRKGLLIFLIFFVFSFVLSVTLDIGCYKGKEITAIQAFEIYQKYTSVNIVDARRSNKFKAGHLRSALNLYPFTYDYFKRLDKLDKSLPYLIYCRSGVKSKRVMSDMLKRGFRCPISIKQGFNSCKEAGFPLPSLGSEKPTGDSY